MNESKSGVAYLTDKSFMTLWPMTLNSGVTSCDIRSKDDDGNAIQLLITRFGPFDIPPQTLRYVLLLLPPPYLQVDHVPFLVETFDGILRQDGSSVRYPPVHPHHSALRMIGPRIQDAWSSFPAFPCASSWSNVWMRGGVSSNLPGFVPDLRCEWHADPNACFYVKLPYGTGLEYSSSSDWWADTMVNDVSTVHTTDVFLEFGRKWKHVNFGILRPVWVFDFAVARVSPRCRIFSLLATAQA